MMGYRIKRRGVDEYLTPAGTPTRDPRKAVIFIEYPVLASVFLDEMFDDHSVWCVEPVHVAAVVVAA